MFENKVLTGNLNDKFNELNTENFKLFGVDFGNKKQQRTDAEEVELLRARQRKVRPTIEANQQLIKFAPSKISGGFRPPVRPYKAKPPFLANLLEGAITGTSTLLAGDAAARPLNDSLPGEDRTTQSNLPAFIVKPENRSKKIFFYGAILIAIIVLSYIALKKKK
jgi:hypothetical protein